MRIKKILCLCIATTALLSASLFSACTGGISPLKATVKKVSSDTLYVTKVKDLKKDFIMGMDASAVLSLEASGVKYYDYDGNEEDVYKILADNGVNTIRVRVWNNPYDKDGKGYGGGNCDINTALEIGKRANSYGMNLMVDFHYSDFWADPSKQMAPLAWQGLSVEEKADALYNYTVESLNLLKEAEIKINVIQIGNETNGLFCGESQWFKMQQLFSAGCKATREVYPKALIALHFANPEKVSNYQDYAKKLDYYKIDYDVFASSYYPYWHGTLENLSELLSEIATTYDKKVMVAETSYAFTEEDSDFYGNTIGSGGGVTKSYPFTVQGQANCIRDIIDTVAHTKNGIGVCYWEGTWISVGTTSYEDNLEKWEQYGSGWATSYAKAYDPYDAGKWYGGCAVDNQAFFDSKGHVLESLKVFSLVRYGNEVKNKVDALEDISLISGLNETLKLPETVNAVMLDDSKKAVSVTWNITDKEIEAMYTAGPQKYDITGTAGGLTVHCYLSMIEKNYVENYSFEDDANKTATPSHWTVIDNKKSDELYVEEKSSDSLTGTKHYHFYSATSNTVDFNLEQQLPALPAGEYKYSISIMGGDGGETEIYAYVKINGAIAYKEDLQITVYNEWHTALINDIECKEGDVVVVGIYVKCQGNGSGAWGKIEDALFNAVTE